MSGEPSSWPEDLLKAALSARRCGKQDVQTVFRVAQRNLKFIVAPDCLPDELNLPAACTLTAINAALGCNTLGRHACRWARRPGRWVCRRRCAGSVRASAS